jgi:hypothetical protein
MRSDRIVSRRAMGALVAAMQIASAATGLAQANGEVFTARANVIGVGGATAYAPVKIVVSRWATDGERDDLIAAVKAGGTAARDLLAARADAGTIQLGSRRTPIKYAHSHPADAGRLVTLLTSEPILFVGAGFPDAKPTAGYDLGLVLIDLDAAGFGHGELARAARVGLDENDAIVTEDYGAEVVRLGRVARK